MGGSNHRDLNRLLFYLSSNFIHFPLKKHKLLFDAFKKESSGAGSIPSDAAANFFQGQFGLRPKPSF